MDAAAVVSLAVELISEVWMMVKTALASRDADALATAQAMMVDALAALKAARAAAVADVAAAFDEAQAEIARPEGT